MGKRLAEIEYEIAQQRDLISNRVRQVRQRSSDDLGEVSGLLSDAFNSSAVKQTIEERPLLAVAGALAAGVVLGMASESVSLGGLAHRAAKGTRQAASAGSGLAGGLGVIAAEEIKSLLDRWMADSRQPADRREGAAAPPRGQRGL